MFIDFTDEQKALRAELREYYSNLITPEIHELQKQEEGTGPVRRKLVEQLGEDGWIAMGWPKEYGGQGKSAIEQFIFYDETMRVGSPAPMLTINTVGPTIMEYGTDAQKETFLRPSIQGEMQAAFALTEPHTGSDASNLKTRAEKVGNKWVLNGTKQFISSGESGDYCMIFAVTDPDAGKKGISAFLTPTDVPGYTVVAKEDKMGQRASDLCQLAFEDLEIPPDMMLGEEGQGYRIALENLTTGRIGIAAQSTGIARAALECATEYAKEREAFGKVIMEHQAVSHRLADMATQVEAAHHLLLHSARLFDANGGGLVEASMAKLFASEMAEKVCSDAVQTLGGYGYVGGFPVDRYYRDVRVCKIYEGTSDVQRMLIARSLAA